jgi:rubrerythrin
MENRYGNEYDVERPVSVGQRVDSDRQLVRLLQIGIVLEEVVEARATRHRRSIADTADAVESHHGTEPERTQQKDTHADDSVDMTASDDTDINDTHSDNDNNNNVKTLLIDAVRESARHRDQLEKLIQMLDAESIAFDKVETLVEAQYGRTEPEDFDDVLYDQLCNEETAYKFYDDLVTAIQASDASFSIDRDRLLTVLERLRAEEAEGVEAVTNLMEQRE